MMGEELTMGAGGSGGLPGVETAYAKVQKLERADCISGTERAVRPSYRGSGESTVETPESWPGARLCCALQEFGL